MLILHLQLSKRESFKYILQGRHFRTHLPVMRTTPLADACRSTLYRNCIFFHRTIEPHSQHIRLKERDPNVAEECSSCQKKLLNWWQVTKQVRIPFFYPIRLTFDRRHNRHAAGQCSNMKALFVSHSPIDVQNAQSSCPFLLMDGRLKK